ncbi:MAG: superoxide dismutase [Fe], partial [Alphaproteobacteria bacterium]|nr:superoxide dismutase [Fe] [Alphaproteobacteria bacterium]
MTEFTLPKLPFAQDALQPHMSANTLSFHYGKHHKAYVDNLNGLIKNRDEYKDMTLQAIVQKSAGVAEDTGIFNNAAQVFNHSFFWNCLSPDGGDKAF